MNRVVRVLTVIFIAAVLAAAGDAWAQAWPSKPIKYIVPFAPDGTTDILARTISEKLSVALGAAPVGDTPEQFGTYVKTEVAKWSDVVKKSGAKVD